MGLDVGLVVGIVGVALGAPALGYAIHTDRDVRKMLRKAQETLDGLEIANESLNRTVQGSQEVLNGLGRVQKGLSTRAVGWFPQYLPDIVRLLDGAERSVEILCDLPAYGAFSDPGHWHDYRHVLSTLNLRSRAPERTFELEVVCLARERRLTHLHEQFQADDWPRLVAGPGFREKLAAFWSAHDGEAARPDELLDDRDAFLDLVMRVENREQELLGSLATHAALPLYVWLVDGRRAVFAVASLPRSPSADAASGQTQEAGFITDDAQLIAALHAIFAQFRETALPEA